MRESGGAEPIAIVGIGAILPGAPTLEDFWRMILARRDAVREAPAERWPGPPRDFFDPRPGAADRVYSTHGAFLDPFEVSSEGLAFDPGFLKEIDPLFGLAVEAGRRAFAQGTNETLDRARAGVILANLMLPTEGASRLTRETYGRVLRERVWGARKEAPLSARDRANLELERHSAELPAGVLAAALGLGGGSFMLDAACASSLYALKLACDELRAGRRDAMLAGGIARPDCAFTLMGFSQLRALSPAGRPAPFDARADGLVVGEGAGIYLLKRLSDALRAGDEIHGLIRAVGLSNDTGGSLLAPDADGQARAMREAYASAGWRPGDADLIECHATGTPIGDAVEIAGLKKLWDEESGGDGRCAIGSAKSNLGHLLTAAGGAGLAKVLLAMRAQTLPPTANFEKPAKALGIEGSPFRIQREPEPWERRDETTPRRAAVSAFGFGGINAHLLVEEWDPEFAAMHAREAAAPRGWAGASASAEPAAEPKIAIIGMEARAGRLGSLRAFQEAALAGRSDLRERPAARAHALEPAELAGGAGAYLEDFDAPLDRFRISPNELAEMLPQQTLMLLAADAAVRDARAEEADWKSGGVFIAIAQDLNATNFRLRWELEAEAAAAGNAGRAGGALAEAKELASPALTAHRVTGSLGSMVASRIARELRAGGPSYAVAGDAQGGARALEIAARALAAGEIDIALAGAVDLCGDARARIADEARGDAPGEGAAAFILKRLEDAERDGDRVYATLAAAGFASGDFREASAETYGLALRRAFAEADLSRGQISLIELGGGRGEAEARAEGAALAKFFGDGAEHEPERIPCAIGCLAPLAGNAGAAAGMLSIAKAALALYQEILPAAPPAEGNLRAAISELARAPEVFHAPQGPQYWLRCRADGPRRAGVGIIARDGNCAHAILEGYERKIAGEAEAIERRQPAGAAKEALFALSGRNAGELMARLDRFAAWLAGAAPGGAAEIETLARRHFEMTPADEGLDDARARGAARHLAFVARNARELADLIEIARGALARGPDRALALPPQAADRIFYSPAPIAGEGDIAFVFPGSGNAFLGMGAGLGARWPEALRKLDGEHGRLLRQFAPEALAPWRLEWNEGWEAEAEARMNADPRELILAQVSHGALLSDIVRGVGVEPSGVIGYSLGESAGYFALRVWTSRDEMVERMSRSKLFTEELGGPCTAAREFWNLPEDEAADWHAALLARPAEAVRRELAGLPRVYLTIVNTPEECVVAGQRAQVMELGRRLGCAPIPLAGIAAVHCPVARSVQKAYRGLHLFPTTPPADVRFYSCAFSRPLTITRPAAADSIVAQAILALDFTKTMEKAYADGTRIFLEMGPRNSCTRMIGRILGDRPHVARSACMPGVEAESGVLRLLAKLVAEGERVDLRALYGEATRVTAHQAVEAREGSAPKLRVRLGGGAAELPREARAEKPAAKGAATEPRTAPQRQAARAPRRESPRPETPVTQPALPFGELSGGAEPKTPTEELSRQMMATQSAAADAHAVFLRMEREATRAQFENLSRQMALLESIPRGGTASSPPAAPALPQAPRAARIEPPPAQPARPASKTAARTPAAPPPKQAAAPPKPIAPEPSKSKTSFTRDECLEFARGAIANVLGREFAEIDRFPTRVRLPDEPLMLVDRITALEGAPRSLGAGRVVTEHDVRKGAWYLDGGRMVPGVAIESGQADLFLSAHLGADFETRGERVYRLLDAAVTFHRELPKPGEVLRYDIWIERFIRQGDTRMFFFHFEGTANGKPLLSMRDGCAGFFSPEQLREGRGLVLREPELEAKAGKRGEGAAPMAAMAREALDDARLAALRAGDLPGAFGAGFAGLPVNAPVTLPEGRLALLDRVTELDPAGGRFGLGLIRAEKDIHAGDWFLTCHFVDDPVMPGTLMHESCLQALRIFMLRMGWIGERGAAAFEPVPGAAGRLRCRGQVTPETKRASYEISVKELGFRPEPYAIADAVMFADGKPIVLVTDISLQLSGMTREAVEKDWSAANRSTAEGGCATLGSRGIQESEEAAEETSEKATEGKGPLPGGADGGEQGGSKGAPEPAVAPSSEFSEIEKLRWAGSGIAPAELSLYDRKCILAFAEGKPSDCFGAAYAPFDRGRFCARLPRPPYLFLDRARSITAAPLRMEAGGEIEGQFDVAPDAWYFAANRQEALPFSVLLEFALQSCGWMAAFMGSALTSDRDLHFRNLGGHGTLHEDLGRDSGMLAAHVKCVNVSRSAGMILQSYRFAVSRAGRLVYDGETSFGFFTREALEQQAGLRGAAPHALEATEAARAKKFALPDEPPFEPGGSGSADSRNGLLLPARAFRFVDEIEALAASGGPSKLGFIRGAKRVDPLEWFFRAHFLGDPVMPGSLGLEAFIQLLKVFALERWGREIAETHRFTTLVPGLKHEWRYRGQVRQSAKRIEIEATVTELDDIAHRVRADGLLFADGLGIYEMKGFALEAPEERRDRPRRTEAGLK